MATSPEQSPDGRRGRGARAAPPPVRRPARTAGRATSSARAAGPHGARAARSRDRRRGRSSILGRSSEGRFRAADGESVSAAANISRPRPSDMPMSASSAASRSATAWPRCSSASRPGSRQRQAARRRCGRPLGSPARPMPRRPRSALSRSLAEAPAASATLRVGPEPRSPRQDVAARRALPFRDRYRRLCGLGPGPHPAVEALHLERARRRRLATALGGLAFDALRGKGAPRRATSRLSHVSCGRSTRKAWPV